MTRVMDVLQRIQGDAAADELFQSLTLRDVRLVKWSGEVDGEGSIRKVVLSPAFGGYSRSKERITCRYDQDVTIDGFDSVRIAAISVAIAVDFHANPENAVDIDSIEGSVLSDLLVPSAWEIAYPYVREAVQTMSTRLALDPVALGLLDPRALAPQDVHVRKVAGFRSSV